MSFLNFFLAFHDGFDCNCIVFLSRHFLSLSSLSLALSLFRVFPHFGVVFFVSVLSLQCLRFTESLSLSKFRVSTPSPTRMKPRKMEQVCQFGVALKMQKVTFFGVTNDN